MKGEVDKLVAVVIPNWNGIESLGSCLKSLSAQSLRSLIIMVDNGSVDGSVDFVRQKFPEVVVVVHPKNLGFTGGVNAGIKYALALDYKYVALFNNDAQADKDWLKYLIQELENNKTVGIAAAKMLSANGKTIDSTGDLYTSWGLPFPRGRDEEEKDQYESGLVFGASGGASLYRSLMLEEIGLFDNNFFAYYEDVDISFRAQLANWKVTYVSKSIVYHKGGETSKKIKGFTTYQTMKNLPMLLIKNVPFILLPAIFARFVVAYISFFVAAAQRKQFRYALKGFLVGLCLLPKKLYERWQIQANKKVSDKYIKSIIINDLPPNAQRLRRLWHK